jgi:hypothetical protein
LERLLLKQAQRGRVLPADFNNAPELFLGNSFWYECFCALNTCRPVGWGLAPIPLNVIIEHAQYMDLDEDQESDLIYFIRAMDNAYLKYHADKAETDKQAKTPKR